MGAGVENIPEIPLDSMNQVTGAVGQLYAGSQKVNQGVGAVSSALVHGRSGKGFPKWQQPV